MAMVAPKSSIASAASRDNGRRTSMESDVSMRWADEPDTVYETERNLQLSKLHDISKNNIGGMVFLRTEARESNALIGRCMRSPLSGEVRMDNLGEFPDYTLVDLWTRHKPIRGTVTQFFKDGYFLKPVPLTYRTWIYHQWYLARRVNCGDNVSGSGMLQAVLSERCIDVPVNAGRWSPLLCYVPAVLAFCMTGDLLLILPGAICLLAIQYLTISTNNPEYYRYVRLVTLPLRLAFFGVLIWRFQFDDMLALVGELIGVLACLIDFGFGDIAGNLLCYRYTCQYEIIRSLPNRVFICRRIGAASAEAVFGDRGQVPECVSGIGSWDRAYMIVADIHGLLVELRPVKEEEWGLMQSNFLVNFEALTFVGIDVYDEDTPTALAIDADGPALAKIKAEVSHYRAELWKAIGPPPMPQSRKEVTIIENY